jgi:cyclic beta-1,2-glucan synthetase
MLNPVNHTRTPADVAHYKTEPYVIAGDVYSSPMHRGRGGWSWYTGSAGWMYRAGLESILGLRRKGATFVVDPCIPSTWKEYEIAWTVSGARYEITVANPDGRCRGVVSAELDGVAVNPGAIPLARDGMHRVHVLLGSK